MRLPTSFIGRLIGPQRWLHVDSKLCIMVNFQVTEEFWMRTSVGRNQYARQENHILFPDNLGRRKMALMLMRRILQKEVSHELVLLYPMVQWPGHPWARKGCSCKF